MINARGNTVCEVHPQRLIALEARNQQRHELLTALKNLADMVHYSRRPDVTEDFAAEALQGALVFAEAIIEILRSRHMNTTHPVREMDNMDRNLAATQDAYVIRVLRVENEKLRAFAEWAASVEHHDALIKLNARAALKRDYTPV